MIVALGGFLMGFDASVISGVVRFIEPEFALSKVELGWAVASLTLTATLAMLGAGPLSDRIGRRPVLQLAAVLFTLSAIGSALAPDYLSLVFARMLGGFGVGTALILAPVYIAEIAPPDKRGRLVSVNQLNIVVGISVAFFSNYLVLRLGQSDLAWASALRLGEWNWRWMLGLELLPASLYFAALFFVPESPRWLVMRGREAEALNVLEGMNGKVEAARVLRDAREQLDEGTQDGGPSWRSLFSRPVRLVLSIGLIVAVLQQITGINAVFFYAPMIFEQSGIGTDAAFMQAVLVGLTNVAFTVVALLVIDRLGRRPLLLVGVGAIAMCMAALSWGFSSATYSLQAADLASLPSDIDRSALTVLLGQTFDSDLAYRAALEDTLGPAALRAHEGALVTAAITVQPALILVAILGFVASFAVSLGPVMWVLFSELFPNRIRGIAVSFCGLVNSAVSFSVQFLFPWALVTLGNARTFLVFSVCAVLGLLLLARLLPETKGLSLEALEAKLVRR